MAYSIKNLQKSFGNLEIFKAFNMEIEDNKIIAILGPSGCGKTTLLNIIAGIIKPEAAEIKGFENKTFSYVFQEPRLLEWKTVEKNIEFVLKDKILKQKLEDTTKKCLEIVELWKYKDYYPKKLSGGMKQRTAIARAFAYPSDILLMDEPFKSLDFQLKLDLIRAFIKLWVLDCRMVFLVTHDIQTAVMLGDEIYILSNKPTIVKEKIINEFPRHRRNLQEKYNYSLEQRLYEYFLKSY